MSFSADCLWVNLPKVKIEFVFSFRTNSRLRLRSRYKYLIHLKFLNNCNMPKKQSLIRYVSASFIQEHSALRRTENDFFPQYIILITWLMNVSSTNIAVEFKITIVSWAEYVYGLWVYFLSWLYCCAWHDHIHAAQIQTYRFRHSFDYIIRDARNE